MPRRAAKPTAKHRSNSRKTPAPLRFPATGDLAKHWRRLVALATQLPGVEESQSYGTPALKVRGKFLARLRTQAEGGLAIGCDFVERHMLMQADPDTFYITDHYANSPMVLVDLRKVRWAAMPQLVEQAWRRVATAKAVRDYDAREG